MELMNDFVEKAEDIIDDKLTSSNNKKRFLRRYMLKEFQPDITILDIGIGQGENAVLLRDYFRNIDGIEVCEVYVDRYKLKNKYENVFVEDALSFKFKWYDVILLCDVLEHMTYKNSLKLLNRLKDKCNRIIISVPYSTPLEGTKLNPLMAHIQDSLTQENMLELYPMLECLKVYNDVGIYLLKSD